MDIVTNESVTALARTLGNKRGWKARMPAMAPGLPAGGEWSQERLGNVVCLRYRINGKAHFIGEWAVDAPADAPSTNGSGPKRALVPPPPAPDLEEIGGLNPLIMLTPVPGGAWRLNGYGVARAELIRALRLSLVHLVAREAGALIIDEVAAPEMAVVAEGLPRLPQPRNDKTAGKRAYRVLAPAAPGAVSYWMALALVADRDGRDDLVQLALDAAGEAVL